MAESKGWQREAQPRDPEGCKANISPLLLPGPPAGSSNGEFPLSPAPLQPQSQGSNSSSSGGSRGDAAAFPTSEEKHFHKSASRYMCAQFRDRPLKSCSSSLPTPHPLSP